MAEGGEDWAETLASTLEGAEELPRPYWDMPGSVHGDDSIIRQLHAGENPALRGARMWVQREAHKIHACWPLGANVCGHTGIGHGGVTGLLIDETFGTLYTTLLEPEMGPGFTVNLNMDFRKPVLAGTSIYITAEVESVDGRKVKLKGCVLDRPEGTVLLEATALFVTPKKPPPA